MAMNTPHWQQQYSAPTTTIGGQRAESAVLIVDTNKNTAVIMDGSTMGGHPLAKESVKLKSGSPNVKINGGDEANLSGDITIQVLPGTIPGGMVVVTDPEGQAPGQYLEVSYTDADGSAKKHYISLNKLVDKYLAGAGIKIEDNVVSVDAETLVGAVVKPGGGLAVDGDGNLYVTPDQLIDTTPGNKGGLKVEDGKIKVDLGAIVDPDSPLKVVDGMLTLGNLVSADAGNNLKAGSDGGVFYPANLGTL